MPAQNSRKTLFFYGLFTMPLALLGLPLYIYLPTFYAQNLGLGVFGVGLVLFVARLIDVVTDPLVGYIGDRYFSRKSLIFTGIIILLISFYLLVFPPLHVNLLWLFILSLCVYAGWSLASISYFALGADLAKNSLENTRFSSWREFFNIFGVLFALIVPYVANVAQDPKQSLHVMWYCIGIFLPLFGVLFLFFVNQNNRANLTQSMGELFGFFVHKVRNSWLFFLSFFLNNFANALPATLFLLFTQHVIGAQDSTGLLLLIYFISGVGALPFWFKLAQKIGKKKAWIISMCNASFFFAFVPFLSFGDLFWFGIITFFSGLSLGADMALAGSMQADIAQHSSRKMASNATFFSFFAMLTKLSLAAGVGVSFMVLGLAGFTPENPNPNALFTLTLLYGTLPVFLKLLASYCLFKFKELDEASING